MDAERKKHFVGMLSCSLLTAFLVSVLLMTLYSLESGYVERGKMRRKKAILQSIATSSRLSTEEKLNILHTFRNYYRPTYEYDEFYESLVRAFVVHPENRVLVRDKITCYSPKKREKIELRDGKGVWNIYFFCGHTTVDFQGGDGGGKITSYDIFGEKVAECSSKDGCPFDGTLWCVWYTSGDIICSKIETYKDGKLVSKKEYKREELEDLLQAASRIWRR
jgi:hypothetical protein